MSIKFNDTQLVLLSAASQRDDHCLVPPTGPKRGQRIVKANEYSRFSALNSAERGGNSRAKTVELQPALVREQAV